MENQGRFKWEKSKEERCKLTADTLIGIIDEFNLYGYSVAVGSDDDLLTNTILFLDDKKQAMAIIEYGEDKPVNVVVYDSNGKVIVDETMK